MIDEKELQELEKYYSSCFVEGVTEDINKLIAEVRRLNEVKEALLEMDENKHEIIKGLEQENQRLKEITDLPIIATLKEYISMKEALEHIKETCKGASAYTKEAEVYRIAHVELKGEEE